MENGNQPAFPIVNGVTGVITEEGLTKREYFSAMAMQGMLSNPALYEIASTRLNPNDMANFYAECAAEQADALLTHLSNQSK